MLVTEKQRILRVLEMKNLKKIRELLVSDHKFTIRQLYYSSKNIVYGKYQFLNVSLHYVLHIVVKFLRLLFFSEAPVFKSDWRFSIYWGNFLHINLSLSTINSLHTFLNSYFTNHLFIGRLIQPQVLKMSLNKRRINK
jgi:hypothetical protein